MADPSEMHRFSLADIGAGALAVWAVVVSAATWAVKGWLLRRRLAQEQVVESEKRAADHERRVEAAVARVRAEMSEKAELSKTIDGLRTEMRDFSSQTQRELTAIRASQAAHDDTLRIAQENSREIQRIRERLVSLEEQAGALRIIPSRRRDDS